MGISYRTQTFHDIKHKLANLEGDDVNPEKVESIIESFGVDVDKYFDESEVYYKKYDRGEVDPSEGFGPAPVAMVTSALGRAGKGIVELGDMILPESVSNTVGNFADDISEYIPTEVKRTFQETFDPYHGEGLTGDIRNIGAEIGSYLVPYLGAVKVAKGALGLGKLGRNVAGIGTANLTYSAYERPEDNIANIIVDRELLPEEYLDKIRSRTIDLDDPEEQQFIDQLINNLAFEGILGGTIVTGGKVLKALTKSVAPKISEVTRLDRFFTATGGTDETMLELAVKKDGAASAAFTKVRGFNEPLEKELKDKGLYNDDYLENVVNKALEGDQAAKDILRQDSVFAADTVDLMRNEIDNLSSFVSNNFLKDGSDLQIKINENLGTYLNRSYRAFDDPKYKFKDIPENIKQDAASYLRREFNIPEEDIGEVLRQLVEGQVGKTDKEVFDTLFNSKSVNGSTSRATAARKDIPIEIRKLWGETKNPFKNFQNTIEKLSAFKSEFDYLDGVKRHLDRNDLARKPRVYGGMTIFDNIPTDRLRSIGDAGNERINRIVSGFARGDFKNPLEGLYADKNYQKIIQDTLSEDGFFGANPNSIIRGFLKAKSISQLSKTVGNPATHFRNMMGNTVLMTANGMLPGLKGWKEATNTVGSKFRNVSSKELADNVAKYQELGIIDSGVTANIIRQVASDAFKLEPNGLGQKILNRTGGDKLFKVYQAEDDFFKVMHFEKTKDYLKKAYSNIDPDELDRLAAQRTRDLMPNYNLVPRGFKKLRGAPVGDFLAFPAEMMRVTKNLVKYTMQDLASNNPRLVAEGMKRLGGITAAGLGGDMASDYSQAIFGISEDQKDAINNLVPSYSANTAKIFLSPFKKAGGNTVVDYIDLGPLDPFEYLKIGGRTLHSAVDKLYSDDQQFTTDDALKLTLQLSDQMLGPFLGTSMITQGFLDAAGQGQNFETPTEVGDAFKNIAIGTGEIFEPGFIKFLRNRLAFQEAKAKALGEEGISINSFLSDPTGTEVSKYGYSTPTGGLVSGAAGVTGYDGLEEFFGLKKARLDLTQGMRRNILPITSDLKNTGQYVNEKLASYALQSPDDVYDAYVKGQTQKISKFRKLQATLDSYRSLLEGDYINELQKGLTQNYTRDLGPGVATFINAANSNTFIPDDVSETLSKVRFQTGAPLPLERINNLYTSLFNTAIREE